MINSRELVVDTNILTAALIEPDRRRNPSPNHFSEHNEAAAYLDGIAQGNYRFHIPKLALIELCSVIQREVTRNADGLWASAHRIIQHLADQKLIALYNVDDTLVDRALQAAVRYKTKGADSVFVALSEQLAIPLLTFDNDILKKYPVARRP